MNTTKIQNGTRVVMVTEDMGRFSSRLYVNNGETATLVCAKHKTLKGAQRWAAKVMV